MTRYDTGITRTTMYGHYNAYAIYKLENGKWKTYKWTFTDSEFFDKWNSDKWSEKRKEKEALKKARNDLWPKISDERPDYRYLGRAFH